MLLSEVSFDLLATAELAQLYDLAHVAGVPDDDDDLVEVEDLRDRLFLMKRKLEGTCNRWENLFVSVLEETGSKLDPLLQLMGTVREIFQAVPFDSLSEILKKEGRLQQRNLMEELSARIDHLKDSTSLVVVAGETNGGKSTFLNLLLGESILPTDVLHCTFTVCKMMYSEHYSIKTVDTEGQEEHYPCSSREEVQIILKNKVTQDSMTRREEQPAIREVVIGLPANILKSGVVLVDTPGIGENDVMDCLTMDFIKFQPVSAFIYVIKSDTAGGVQQDKLLGFLRAIRKQYTTDSPVRIFDPGAAMFVCHRWDNVSRNQRDKVRDNALDKLNNGWPGFEPQQAYFFSSKDTMKHLKVDAEYVTDNLMSLLEGLRSLFDRAARNNIRHHYMWLKGMLQSASCHLKSMITHCILSNEELEDYFRRVDRKQNKLMISSAENSRRLQEEMHQMAAKLRVELMRHLDFDTLNPWLELRDLDDLVEVCSGDNFFVSLINRRTLDEMIVHRLLKHVDDFMSTRHIVEEMESNILSAIHQHLGLFQCQVNQIKQDLLHGRNHSPSSPVSSGHSVTNSVLSTSSGSVESLEQDTSLGVSLRGIVSDPSLISMQVSFLLSKRKENKTRTVYSKHEIHQSLLGKITDRIRHGLLNRQEPGVFVEERVKKISRDIRSDQDIMAGIIHSYTEWIQKYIECALASIPAFIEVNQKLMEQIREHRSVFQTNKACLVKAMEDLEPCRQNLKGYGLLFMNDIMAETLDLNYVGGELGSSGRSESAVSASETSRASFDSGSHPAVSKGFWTMIHSGNMKMNDGLNEVVLKTYNFDLGQSLLSEISALRYLEHRNLAMFLGMARMTSRRGSDRATPQDDPSISDRVKVPAFVFKGELVSAMEFCQGHANLHRFVPRFITCLLSGLSYIHGEGLVHMELNLNTVMVDKMEETVKLCMMGKPREAHISLKADTLVGDLVCLSPDVLQGNLYESTDDIYAFGLLLWELLVPRQPPYQQERSWLLTRFLQEVHPVKMLRTSLQDLLLSQEVKDVLKGTLLLSRGQRCMSIPNIQRKLVDLNEDPSLASMASRTSKEEVQNNTESIVVKVPDVELVSPAGTQTKINFTFEDVLPENTKQAYPLSISPRSRKDDTKADLQPLTTSNNDTGPTLNSSRRRKDSAGTKAEEYTSNSVKYKQKYKNFLARMFKLGSVKNESRNLDPANKGREKSKSLSNLFSPDSEAMMREESLDPRLLTPKIRRLLVGDCEPVRKSRSVSHIKHRSLPFELQPAQPQKTGSLNRTDSFDVPTLLFQKFRSSSDLMSSLGNSSSGLNVSTDAPLYGSMPVLRRPMESSEFGCLSPHTNHGSFPYLSQSSNPRIQNPRVKDLQILSRGTAVQQHSSWLSRQGKHRNTQLENSLQTSSPTLKSKLNSLDTLEECISSQKHEPAQKPRSQANSSVGSQRHSFPHVSKVSPLAKIDQHPESSFEAISTALPQTTLQGQDCPSRSCPATDLSSSDSSTHEADSGCCTDLSMTSSGDLQGSYGDLSHSTSRNPDSNVASKAGSGYIFNNLPRDEKLSCEASLQPLTTTFADNLKRESTSFRASTSKDNYSTYSYGGTSDIAACYVTPENDLFSNANNCDGFSESLNDKNNSEDDHLSYFDSVKDSRHQLDRSIPPPPPLNLSEMSFSFSRFDSVED